MQHSLIAEAHQLLHNSSLTPKAANDAVDRIYTQAERKFPKDENTQALVKFDHATLVDIYGVSHNDQASKDRAVEILNSLPSSLRNTSPEIAGAIVQAKSGLPIDLRSGKAAAIGFEDAAETALKGSDQIRVLNLC